MKVCFFEVNDSGMYIDDSYGMYASSINHDVDGGQQPISNENGNIWVILNGNL